MAKLAGPVIVVDDDAAVRDSLKFALQLEGLAVRLYGSGAELLADPDLPGARCLVIDYKMPGMSGIELFQRLRARHLHYPAILMTVGITEDLRECASRSGFQSALEKSPFRMKCCSTASTWPLPDFQARPRPQGYPLGGASEFPPDPSRSIPSCIKTPEHEGHMQTAPTTTDLRPRDVETTKSYPFKRAAAGLTVLIGGAAWAVPAEAHVKWFAPYIVGAAPQPISATLTNQWFWLAIGLVLFFFLATVAVERSRFGQLALNGMDRISDPLWRRADDFMRVTIGAFFVAIFAVSGIYLTPDLKTPAEWVSWAQLLIAAGIFSRKTMPVSAAGIIALWVVALREYDLFHLLDYLALGVGVAAYLVLESSNNEKWRKHRFEVLRWAVAIALMWSSLEKFAYPNWFYPLVEEKPFLTFGMPRDMFIPMAGVAEFTMGLD